ncbi:MAG: YfiR family protein [Acidobacteriota bacterium]
MALAFAAAQVHSEAPAAAEYQVKAGFLFNFTKFVEWPPDTFRGPEDAIKICILGQDPFGSGLRDAVKDKVVANRPFVVRAVSSLQQATDCQILFVSASEQKRYGSVLEELKLHSVLTVSEAQNSTTSGGIINFRLKDEQVRIDIDVGAAERAKLQISSKLLKLAEIRK